MKVSQEDGPCTQHLYNRHKWLLQIHMLKNKSASLIQMNWKIIAGFSLTNEAKILALLVYFNKKAGRLSWPRHFLDVHALK